MTDIRSQLYVAAENANFNTGERRGDIVEGAPLPAREQPLDVAVVLFQPVEVIDTSLHNKNVRIDQSIVLVMMVEEIRTLAPLD